MSIRSTGLAGGPSSRPADGDLIRITVPLSPDQPTNIRINNQKEGGTRLVPPGDNLACIRQKTSLYFLYTLYGVGQTSRQ